MCFTELHDEELNNDEEDEDEEGHQREQQDATLPPLQACVLSAGFCEENDRASGSLGLVAFPLVLITVECGG